MKNRNMAHHYSSNNNLRSARNNRNLRRPVILLVVLTTMVLGVAVFVQPSSSLIVLGSFTHSSLWRERYLGSDRQEQRHQFQQQLDDYYVILGVDRTANKDDIKTAFRQLVKQYHPDANPNADTTDQFQRVNMAYQTLSDPQGRRRYNSQMYHVGYSSDTPNFIMDDLEDDSNSQYSQEWWTTDSSTVNSADTTVRYQPHQWEPNENGRGSLLKDDDVEKHGYGTNGGYRITPITN